MFLDRLPPRLQGFKLCLQRVQYSIEHVKGTLNVSADALSRYTSAQPEGNDEERVHEIENYVTETVVPNGSDTRLEQIKLHQRNNIALSKVIRCLEEEWPAFLSSEDSLIRP